MGSGELTRTKGSVESKGKMQSMTELGVWGKKSCDKIHLLSWGLGYKRGMIPGKKKTKQYKFRERLDKTL